MMLSIFSNFYEWCIGSNDDPIYRDQVFFTVGLFTLLIALVFSIVFYLGLGRWKPVFYKLVHWIIAMVFLAIIAALLALLQSKGATKANDFDAYMVRFSLFNVLISVIYYIIFSLLLKRFSIFARHTPF